MPALNQPANVAREPVQGEVGIMEEQQASAPMAGEESQESGPPIEPRLIDQPAQQGAPPVEEPVNSGNLLRVLPPEPPTPQPALSPQETLGYTILGLVGASAITRRLASQLVGNTERGGRLKPGAEDTRGF